MDSQQLAHLIARHPFKELPRKKADDPTYILTCPVRIRWCALGTPRPVSQKGQAPQLGPDGQPIPPKLLFDATFLVPQEANIDPLRNVVSRLMTERFGADFRTTLVKPVNGLDGNTIMVSSISGGVKKQAEMFAKKEAGFSQEGVYFSASSSSQYPPAIIGGQKNPATGNWNELDRTGPEVYAGMWVIAYCKAYARPKKGAQLNNPGISFQLESIQKIADDGKFETRNKVGHFSEIEPHQAPAGAVNGTGAPARAPALPVDF